jgi:hypothetical protein
MYLCGPEKRDDLVNLLQADFGGHWSIYRDQSVCTLVSLLQRMTRHGVKERDPSLQQLASHRHFIFQTAQTPRNA